MIFFRKLNSRRNLPPVLYEPCLLLASKHAKPFTTVLLTFSSLARPSRNLKKAAQHNKLGSSFIICATGNWCGALPTKECGRWHTSTQICWARRTAGLRLGRSTAIKEQPRCIWAKYSNIQIVETENLFLKKKSKVHQGHWNLGNLLTLSCWFHL